MKVNEKIACSFQNWYPLLKDCSFKCICIPVPEEVLNYLKEDLVTIPLEAEMKKPKSENIDDITYTDWDSEGEDDDEVKPPSFPDFSAKLKNAMEVLGGSAFVKMNWSAPTDAAWVATNNCLKCNNLQDVYLLLKCSDKISHDVSSNSSEKFYIVLKKWEDIHPGSEFRCFVSDGHLIAITQRDKSEFHRHILTSKFDIVRDIKDFFNCKLKDKFILPNFVFDVVWQVGSRVKLVDITTYMNEKCETFLFSWSELKNLIFDEHLSPEFRFIGEETGIQPSHLTRHFGMPRDLTEMSSSTSQSLIELLQSQIDIQSKET